jgi:hypothetical protein
VLRPQDRLLEKLRPTTQLMVDRITLVGQSNPTYGGLHPFKLFELMS